MSGNNVSKYIVTALAILGASLLGGCQTIDPSTFSKVEKRNAELEPIPEEYRSVVGQVYVPMKSNDTHPRTMWINDIELGKHTEGFYQVRLLPGEYRLKTKVGRSEEKVLKFGLQAGETKYLIPRGMWVSSPYEIVDRQYYTNYVSGKYLADTNRLKLRSPQQEFLPASEKNLVNSCLRTKELAICEEVLATVPSVMIDRFDHKFIVSMVDRKRQEIAVEEQQKALEASLPPSVLRDRYMISLRDALTARDFEAALPVFDRLQALGLPLDRDFDFFRAEALHETGNHVEALDAIGGYLRDQGRDAQFYQEALQLLNSIQAAL